MSDPNQQGDLDLQQLIEAGLIDTSVPDPVPDEVTDPNDINYVEPGAEHGDPDLSALEITDWPTGAGALPVTHRDFPRSDRR